MRKSRSETIAELRDVFLQGKSQDYINKFNEKNEDQQYAAIAHWKRSAKNLGEATKNLAQVTASTVISHLKDVKKKIERMSTLSPKEAAKLQETLDSLKDSIDNFARIKDQQLLEALKTKKVALAKENEDLDRQIQELQNKLN